MTRVLLINQLVTHLCVYAVCYLLGICVSRFGVRVNYTRKVYHLTVFALPTILSSVFPYEQGLGSIVVIYGSVLLALGLFVEPIRRRSRIVQTMFRAIDRPEDRPYTLLWLSTQIVASLVVFIPFAYLFDNRGMANLMFVPLLVVGIGDGLAEPIGVRFGKHKYTCKAIFSTRTYTRSLEGSLWIYLVCFATVLLFRDMFTHWQFAITLLLLPPLTTLTEARSPHTWDTPTLYLVNGAFLWAVIAFI
jgi:dolichol kinase